MFALNGNTHICSEIDRQERQSAVHRCRRRRAHQIESNNFQFDFALYGGDGGIQWHRIHIQKCHFFMFDFALRAREREREIS